MSSSITKSVVAVAVLAVGLTVPLGTVGPASATPSTSTPPVAVTSRPSVHVARGADGRVALVTPAAGTTTGAPRTLTGGTTRRKSAVTVARTHVDDLAGTLGVDASDLAYSRTGDTAAGPVVRFDQRLDGVPVLGAGVAVAQSAGGDLQTILARTAPAGSPTFPTTAGTTRSRDREALSTAARRVTRSPSGTVSVGPGTRYWYDPAVLGKPGAGHSLTPVTSYVVASKGTRAQVLVSARTHREVLAWKLDQAATTPLKRVVCDKKNGGVVTSTPASYRCNGTTAAYARIEGQAASSVADVNRVYTYFGDTSSAYNTYSGISLTGLIGTDYGDGQGKALRATVRICELEGGCPYPNAFWDGRQMAFGTGLTVDDVTAHELTHGVTQMTSGLQYIYQSGAINESMSDVFGELTDQQNGSSDDTTANRWLIGEGSSLGVLRDMRNPTRSPSTSSPNLTTQPDRMTSSHWNPDTSMFDSGGVHYNSGVGNQAASLMTDGGTFNGYTVSGLGLAKVWKIYYTTENMLISGADYYDLYLALPAACRNLVGVAGTGITATNCAQVDKVVRATEMNKNPTVADSFTPWSTSCPSSTPSRHTLFAEGFESGSTWLRSGTGWYQSQSAAMQATGLASRVDGKGSYMWMPGENVGTARLTQPGTWKVPTTGHVYVRYNMQYAMYEFSSDRLQFQASTDGGTSWSTLVTHTGLSNGWGSVRTDIGTSTYHGKSVKFRFSGVDDAQPLGWVDDLRLYTCT